MKKAILFIFLALSFTVQSQDTTTVAFALDTIRSDSFFLTVTTTIKSQGEKRDRTQTRDFFFSDTTALNSYIDAMRQKLTDLANQKAQIGVEYQSVLDQLNSIEALRDSVFRGMDIQITALPFSAQLSTRTTFCQRMAATLRRRKKRYGAEVE